MNVNLENTYNQCFDSLVSGLTQENKRQRVSSMKSVFTTHSASLINELIANPKYVNNCYGTMNHLLNQVDPRLANEVQPYIARIIKISTVLRFAGMNLDNYENLRFPKDLE